MSQHPTRTFVLQILRLIAWFVIAVALVKLAFFPAQQKTEQLSVQGTFELPRTTVTKGDIENNISLNASILRDEAKTAKATESGEVVWVYVEDGATIGEGAPILQVRKTTEPDPTKAATDEEAPAAKVTYHDIYAPASGTLHLNALVGQNLQIGEEIGTIVPDAFHAEVPITADKLYSLSGLPDSATIAIKDGPAPFACTGLKTITASPNTGGNKTAETTASGPQLRCQIPSDQTVYDGSKGKMQIAGGSVSGVLVVPVTAVEGRFREGYVYLPAKDPNAKPEKVKVKLGITDGKLIEVKEGLSLDQEILEFVPRTNDENEDPTSDTSGRQG